VDFKTYYFEGLIKVPTEYVKQYVDQHIDEFISKINNTLKTNYENYIEDNLIVNNIEIPITILKSIPNSEAYSSVDLNKGTDIYIDANNVKSLMNSKENFKKNLYTMLIHEITHIIDKGAFKKPASARSFDDYSAYVNSDREFPAFLNEYIHKIQNKIKTNTNYKEFLINAFKTGKSTKDREIDKFIKSLNPENKIKFINNVLKSI
jgi:hypothetical protein